MNPTGKPRVEIDVLDASVLIGGGVRGIIGVCVPTERGPLNRPIVVGSWPEYTRYFGGLLSDSNGPLLCRRALEAGGRIKVCRMGHYGNVSDSTTLEGVKAYVNYSVSSNAGTQATNTYTFDLLPSDGDIITVYSQTSLGSVLLGTYTKVPGDSTMTLVITAIKSAINTLTAVHGYSASGTTTLILSAPLADGADANSYAPLVSIMSSTAYTISNGSWAATTFAGGVNVETAHSMTVSAKSIGAWGNNLSFKFSKPKTSIANTVDLFVYLSGYDSLAEVYRNLPVALTTAKIDEINGLSKLIDITNFVGTLSVAGGSLTSLANGVQDVTNITVTDYAGDVNNGNGIHAFDSSGEIIKIACPAVQSPTLDIALAAYADARKDIRAILSTPINLDAAAVVGYRDGTAPYTHTGITSWRAVMSTGGLKITHPTTGLEMEINEIGDVIGLMSRKETVSKAWFSSGGPSRGVIPNNLGVLYDLGTSARSAQADLVVEAGVNPVIVHPTFGTVLWGNRSMYKTPSLLQKDNIADLFIYLTKAIKPIVESELFNPNDTDTWKAIHRKLNPLLKKMVTERAIHAYQYDGDQDVDSVEEASVNSPDTIDQGQYIVNLFIKPIGALEYLGISLIAANTGVDFKEITV